MRRRTALAAAAALLVGLAGCGIPDQTEARDLGAGPDPGYAAAGGAGLGPPARADAPTKEAFVNNFLAAAAGDPAEAEERVRQYLTESSRAQFKPDKDAGVNVVYPRETTFKEAGVGTLQVTLKVDQVGVLNAEGSVGPPVLRDTAYTFEIGGTGGTEGWFVTEPPRDDLLLLSTQALDAYYTPQTLYFWSLDRTTLVPDSRYMPNDLAEGLQPNAIVDWLTNGPSAWLDQVVSRLSEDSKRDQNVPYPAERLEVWLNADAAEQESPAQAVDMVEQLGIQLMWSLRQYLRKDLQLRIPGQSPRVFEPDERFEAFNAAHRPADPSGQEPERFALYQGKIHRLTGSPGGGTQPLPQLLLQEGANRGLVSAALAREVSNEGTLTAAALVTQQGQQFQLRVGSAYGDGARPFRASKAYTRMGRPVWLKAPMDTGLIMVDGNLYRFTPEDADLQRVPLPPLFSGKVDDVSAAPDGRRIAVAAGGKVYVLTVPREGAAVEVRKFREVPTSLQHVVAVDWSEETKIVVAGDGPDNKPVVWQVSLDGAIVERHVEDVGGKVTSLAAYPDDPVAPSRTVVMYAREGAAYDLTGIHGLIEAGEVVGASGEFKPADVTAPFFLLD